VQRGLENVLQETQANELMIVSNAYDHADRLRSYEITAQVAGRVAREASLQPATAS